MTGLSGQHHHRIKSLKNYWVSGHYLLRRIDREIKKKRQEIKVNSHRNGFQRSELLCQEASKVLCFMKKEFSRT